MNHPTKPSLAHVILDLLLSPTYRLPKTVTAVRIYRDETSSLFVQGAMSAESENIKGTAIIVGNASIGQSWRMQRKLS